ncbi:MAG: universal stress protein [Pyrinomonadaceae bacterium]
MKILVAADGSQFSQAAVEKCSEMFAGSGDNEIRIITAAEPVFTPAEPFALSAEYLDDINSAALKKATDVVSQAEAEMRKGHTETAVLSTRVVNGYANQAIVTEAEAWGADLIILGSHGYGLWRRALLGSVSNSVLHHAPCSVLVVRARAGKEK